MLLVPYMWASMTFLPPIAKIRDYSQSIIRPLASSTQVVNHVHNQNKPKQTNQQTKVKSHETMRRNRTVLAAIKFLTTGLFAGTFEKKNIKTYIS